MSCNIAIIGMPYAGKTSVGKLVAERIGATFIDTDELIELKLGLSVSAIFDKFGEDKFRELECEAVRAAVESKGAVIALGGGAVMRRENVEALSVCKVVYLRVDEETIISRLNCEGSRPLLNGNAVDTVRRLMIERAEAYERTANIIVDVSSLSLAQAADTVVEALGK